MTQFQLRFRKRGIKLSGLTIMLLCIRQTQVKLGQIAQIDMNPRGIGLQTQGLVVAIGCLCWLLQRDMNIA